MSEAEQNEQLRDLRRRVSDIERREFGFSAVGFAAGVSQTMNNVTGDGTICAVIFDSEIFDIGGNYDPAYGIFTAPATDKYLLGATVTLAGITNSHTAAVLGIYTTSQTLAADDVNPYAAFSAAGLVGLQCVGFGAMAAGETAWVGITVSGGTLVVDVYGTAALARTRFWGLRIAR